MLIATEGKNHKQTQKTVEEMGKKQQCRRKLKGSDLKSSREEILVIKENTALLKVLM